MRKVGTISILIYNTLSATRKFSIEPVPIFIEKIKYCCKITAQMQNTL